MTEQNPNDSNSNNSPLLEQAREQAKKNPTLVVIAIVLVVMFLFAFIPFPLPCKDCAAASKRYVSLSSQEIRSFCRACDKTGYKSITVWRYMNQ